MRLPVGLAAGIDRHHEIRHATAQPDYTLDSKTVSFGGMLLCN
jgi:hypothetical protein